MKPKTYPALKLYFFIFSILSVLGVQGKFSRNQSALADNIIEREVLVTNTQLINEFSSTPLLATPPLLVITVDAFGGATELCPNLEASQFGEPYGICEAAVSISFAISGDCDLLDDQGNLVSTLISADLDLFVVDENENGIISEEEFATDTDVTANIIDDGNGTYTFSGYYPIIPKTMGDNVFHAIRVLLEDGCNNQVSEIILFDVIDCKRPAPICINGLTITLMPQPFGPCSFSICGSDFEAAPIYDCTGQGPEVHPVSGLPRITQYALYHASEASVSGFVPDPTHECIVLNNVDDASVVVYIYAFDKDGNYDFCETYVLVELHVDCGDPVETFGGPTGVCPTLIESQFGDPYGNCDAEVRIPFTVSDDCGVLDNHGHLVSTLISANLDLFVVDENEDGVINEAEFISEAGVTASISFSHWGEEYIFSGAYPIIPESMGEDVFHAIRVVLEDECNNQMSEIIMFDVIDCKGPSPNCLDELTLILEPQEDGGCAAVIEGSDFQCSPTYDCIGQGPEMHPISGLLLVTEYALYRASEAADSNFIPDPSHINVVFTDEDNESVAVYVYAFDEEGNYDFCESQVLLELNLDCDGAGGTIVGLIQTETGDSIEGVEVSLSGTEIISDTTLADGAYEFTNLLPESEFTLVPFMNADFMNGVSTLDIILIGKHILGAQLLDSPYKLIAADINNNGIISSLDMILLRRLILGIDTQFENNTSWRFIPADFDFPVLTDPWSSEFPEVKTFTNLPEGITVADFIGVKIGDVN